MQIHVLSIRMSANSDHKLPYQSGQYPPECHAITLTTGGQYAPVYSGGSMLRNLGVSMLRNLGGSMLRCIQYASHRLRDLEP